MKTNTKQNQLYSKIARFYDLSLWIFGYKIGVYYFIGMIPFSRKAKIKVLDAGSGTGLYTFALLNRFPNAMVQAFDLNKGMAAIMKNTVNQKLLTDRVEVFVSDIVKPLPFQHEQFDLIMIGGVLEYLKDPRMAVKNLSPYLKTGGYFLHSPVKDNWLAKILARLYKFIPHSSITNIEAFTRSGFALEHVRSFPIIKEGHLFKKL